MTNPYLTLEGVSYTLPQGKTLFSHLNETFDSRRTGLVGRNGVGKSILAQILAGQLQPSSGRCLRSGKVHYLAQQVASVSGLRVADL
ncbi:ATP-binding cassette domain-containing protein, partial [Alcaligenes pakistanensis]